jgi:hypothetical protein
MDPEERAALETAIHTIADPLGNWEYGWKLICELAQVDPKRFPAPFRRRTDADIEAALEARRQQPTCGTPPRANPADQGEPIL